MRAKNQSIGQPDLVEAPTSNMRPFDSANPYKSYRESVDEPSEETNNIDEQA